MSAYDLDTNTWVNFSWNNNSMTYPSTNYEVWTFWNPWTQTMEVRFNSNITSAKITDTAYDLITKDIADNYTLANTASYAASGIFVLLTSEGRYAKFRFNSVTLWDTSGSTGVDLRTSINASYMVFPKTGDF